MAEPLLAFAAMGVVGLVVVAARAFDNRRRAFELAPIPALEALGFRALASDADHPGYYGRVDGLAVTVRIQPDRAGTTKWTHVTSDFDAPLEMGLEACAGAAPPQAVAGSQLAAPWFAGTITATSPERAAALFRQPLCEKLAELARAAPFVAVDDARATLAWPGVVRDADVLARELGRLTAFVQLVEEMRRGVPGRRADAHRIATWRTCAERRGLAFDEAPPTMRGRYEGFRVRAMARTSRSSGDRRVEASLVFEELLGAGLHVFPEAAEAVKARRGPYVDVRVGEARFDRVFVVHAERRDRAIALLGPDVRAALEAAAVGASAVELYDAGVRVRAASPSLAPDVAYDVLDRCVSVAIAVTEAAKRLDGGKTAGFYR